MFLISEVLKEMKIVPDYNITKEAPIDTLGLVRYSLEGKKQCTFIDDPKYISLIESNTRMIITTEEISVKIINQGTCITKEPRVLFFSIHNELKDNEGYCRKKCKTVIGSNCKINRLACVAENNVVIGDNVTIEEFVSIKEGTIIGDNAVIRAGSIIGSEGFEFKRYNNSILPVVHLGGVIIGDNAEIQSNTCIDKALYPWDNTVIGENTKIDKLVYISHGVKVGKNVLILGQSGVLGRTVIGDYAKIGMGSGFRNALNIGVKSEISLGAIVTRDVEDGTKVSGNFAIEHNKFMDFIKSIR